MFDTLYLLLCAVHEKSEEHSSIPEVFPKLPLRLDPLDLLPTLRGVVPDPVPGCLPGHLYGGPGTAHGAVSLYS